jgi:hypothetical protein
MNKYQTSFILITALTLAPNMVQAEGLIYHEELFNDATQIQQVEDPILLHTNLLRASSSEVNPAGALQITQCLPAPLELAYPVR